MGDVTPADDSHTTDLTEHLQQGGEAEEVAGGHIDGPEAMEELRRMAGGRPVLLEGGGPTVTRRLVNVQLAVSDPDVAEGEARLIDLEGMLAPADAAALLRRVADGLHYEPPQRWLMGMSEPLR